MFLVFVHELNQIYEKPFTSRPKCMLGSRDPGETIVNPTGIPVMYGSERVNFNIPASTGWTRGGWILGAGQEREWCWQPILELHLYSGSVGPASRVDFGQLYKNIQYIISYMYMYMYYNQPSKSPSWDVTN